MIVNDTVRQIGECLLHQSSAVILLSVFNDHGWFRAEKVLRHNSFAEHTGDLWRRASEPLSSDNICICGSGGNGNSGQI